MNRVHRYVRSWRVSRKLARDPEWVAQVEKSYALLLAALESGEPLDTVDMDELRALFGTEGREGDLADVGD